jgi:hypothetical protein
MQDNHPYFTIGKESSEFLKVEILNYQFPNATEYWDSSWLNTTIQIKVGAFSAKYSAQLQTIDFSSFEKELKRLYTDLNGVTQFYSIENWLNLKFKGDGIGHFEVRGTACDFPGTGNTLKFNFEIDQTYIPILLNQLSNILEKFPVKGK